VRDLGGGCRLGRSGALTANTAGEGHPALRLPVLAHHCRKWLLCGAPSVHRRITPRHQLHPELQPFCGAVFVIIGFGTVEDPRAPAAGASAHAEGAQRRSRPGRSLPRSSATANRAPSGSANISALSLSTATRCSPALSRRSRPSRRVWAWRCLRKPSPRAPSRRPCRQPQRLGQATWAASDRSDDQGTRRSDPERAGRTVTAEDRSKVRNRP